MVTISRSKTSCPHYPGLQSSFQLTKGPRPPAEGRGHDIQGRLGESGRSGSRLLQSPFPGEKGFGRLETRDRPLSPQRVREANPIQNGDCLFSPSLGNRGRLPSIHRPEGRLLSGARLSLLLDVAPFRLGRLGPPVPSPLLRTINRPSGLHTGVRHSVDLGPLPGRPPPPVPGRLAGTGLFGGQGKTACPGTLVAVPLPRDNAQRQEVRTGPLTVSGVPRHDHRHGGGTSVPHHDSNKQTPLHWEEIPRTPVSPRPAVAGVVGTHIIAGEVSFPQEIQDALTPVAIDDTLVPRNRPPPPVPRSRQVEEDLAWWMKTTHLLQGRPFGTPAPDLRLYSDASRSGWGVHLLDRSVSGVWSQEEISSHINLLEMKALFLALQAFKDLVTVH